MLEAGTLLGVTAAGLLAGVASGLFGVGGGILMVPATIALLPDTTFHDAKAVSLLVIVGSAAVGTWTHHRRGSVDLRLGALLALGGFAGTVASVSLVERVDGGALALAFSLVLALTGIRLTLQGQQEELGSARPRAKGWIFIALGVLSGLLSGAFGVGGGIVMVPGMVLAGVGIHLAVGTSLVAVLGNALGGTLAHLALGYGATLLQLGIPLAVGAVPGGYLGAKLAHRLHADRLRALFGAGLLLVAAWMAYDTL